jgi:hypothetical protein
MPQRTRTCKPSSRVDSRLRRQPISKVTESRSSTATRRREVRTTSLNSRSAVRDRLPALPEAAVLCPCHLRCHRESDQPAGDPFALQPRGSRTIARKILQANRDWRLDEPQRKALQLSPLRGVCLQGRRGNPLACLSSRCEAGCPVARSSAIPRSARHALWLALRLQLGSELELSTPCDLQSRVAINGPELAVSTLSGRIAAWPAPEYWAFSAEPLRTPEPYKARLAADERARPRSTERCRVTG